MAETSGATAEAPSRTAATGAGAVGYTDQGDGSPVLFVHGSPGGSDQGSLMGAFLVEAGFRVVAPARPGYPGTELDDTNATPDAQAVLELALMDELGIDRFSIMCWSGGGPSSYRLAATNPDRVQRLVALAAVSQAFTFENALEETMLTGGFGGWLMKELARHSPKQVVKMLATEEGDLTKEQARTLVEHIWEDPAKREFVLALTATVSGGRTKGFTNDRRQFPHIDDLGLAGITTPTLLVHGTVDSDVPPAHSEYAAATLPASELLRVTDGTHISTWTDPTSEDIQHRIVEFLRRP